MKNSPVDQLHPDHPVKENLTGILSGFFIVMTPAFLFALKNDMPHVPVIAFLILLSGMLLRKPLPPKDRPVIYCITGAMILTVLPDLVVSMDETRYGLFDILIRTTLVLPFLVYAAAFGSLFSPSARIAGARAALAAGAMLLCGDRFNTRGLSNALLGFLDPLLRQYYLVYICCAALQMAALPVFFYSVYRKGEHNGIRLQSGGGKRDFLLHGFFILLIPLFAYFSMNFYQKNGAFLRSIEFFFMRLGVNYHMNIRRDKATVSRQVDLRAPLPPFFGQFPDMVFFRARSKFPPGLLRSGVYADYDNGRWNPPERISVSLDTTRRTGILAFNTFRLKAPLPPENQKEEEFDREKNMSDEKEENRIDLFFDGLQTAGLIPAPGNALRMDAVADHAEITGEGLFSLKHWKMDGGVTFYVRSPDPESAFTPEKTNEKLIFSELTEVPPDIRKEMQKIWKEIPGRKETGREKTAALTRYLSSFQYSLSPPRPKGEERSMDPVLRFLKVTKKGHCELFASAAVLLFRTAGLPARYVTGFVCEEKSPFGDYYSARLAHAWCEVWLPEEKRWIAADATPPADRLWLRHRKSPAVKELGALLKQYGKEFFADIRRGYFADAILGIFVKSWGLLVFLSTTWLAFLFYPAVVFVIVRYILIRRRRRNETMMELPEMKRKLSSEFSRFEKKFASLAGRPRKKEETPTSYYGSFGLLSLMKLIREYERHRFSNGPITDLMPLAFRMKSEKVLEEFRRSRSSGKEV